MVSIIMSSVCKGDIFTGYKQNDGLIVLVIDYWVFCFIKNGLMYSQKNVLTEMDAVTKCS